VDWLVWIAVALVAGVAEVASLQFVLAMFAGGGLVAALAAGLGAGVEVQVVAFALASVALLLGARPPLVRWSRRTAGAVTGVAALVGRRAEVVSEVSGAGGQVKLAGEIWSARTEQPGLVLPTGMQAVVHRIDGATAVVAAEPPPIESGPAETPFPTEPSR
jgi:membrane protein implicated in regulation of membrane protease activity